MSAAARLQDARGTAEQIDHSRIGTIELRTGCPRDYGTRAQTSTEDELFLGGRARRRRLACRDRSATGLVAIQEGLAFDLGEVKFGAAILGFAVFRLVVGDELA